VKRIKFSPTLGHLTNFCTNFYDFFNLGKFVKIREFFCWGNEFSIYAVRISFFKGTRTHVHVPYMLSPVRPSVVCLSVCLSVCNASVLYSAGWNFSQFFYAVWHLSRPLTSTENFTEIVTGETLHREFKTTGVAKYSDFGPIVGYISETVQGRR